MEDNRIESNEDESDDGSRGIDPGKGRLIGPSLKVEELQAASNADCKVLVEDDRVEEEERTELEDCLQMPSNDIRANAARLCESLNQ